MSAVGTRVCRECSTRLEATAAHDARFCATRCKDAYNNRRKNRGAELYDAFMIYRYQRGPAKLLGIWSLVCRMASVWNEEDKRAGRVSYATPEETKMRLVRYVATMVDPGR